VKGTVRSSEKGEEWISLFPNHRANFQYAIVEDITKAGAFDEAIKGCDFVAHIASPVHWGPGDNEKDVLIPAINGTKNLVEATKLEPRVKRVVLTSSLAAVINPALPADTLHTSEEWNPITYEEAKGQPTPMLAYRASKALAEKAFWDYIKDEKPSWFGTVIAPSAVFGAPLQKITSLSKLNISVKYLWNMADGTYKAGVPAIGFPVCTDIRDVALAHVRAVERDAAKNQRYLVIGHTYNPDKCVEIIGKAHPELKESRLPPVDNAKLNQVANFKYDTSKAERDLGITYTPFEQTVLYTIDYLLEVEKKLAAK